MRLLLNYFFKPVFVGALLTLISYIFYTVLPTLFQRNRKERNFSFINIQDLVLGWAFISVMLIVYSAATRQFDSESKALQLFIGALLLAFMPLHGWIIQPLTYSWTQKRFTALPEWEHFIRQETGLAVRVLLVNKNFYNALATGALPFAHVILLGRPLVEKLTQEELKALVLHEVGHIANRDLPRLCLLSMMIAAASIFVFSWTQVLMDAHHVGSYWVAIYGSLQYILVYGIITGPLTKRMEYRADAFAAERVGSSTCAAMLTHLDQLTGGMLTRGNFTHPTLQKRLRNIDQQTQVFHTNSMEVKKSVAAPNS